MTLPDRNYELMFILSGKSSKDEIKEMMAKIEKAIVGKIVKKDDWGIKEFAYEIKKEKSGHYVVYYANTNPDSIDKVNHIVRIDKNILRSMIIKHEEWPSSFKI